MIEEPGVQGLLVDAIGFNSNSGQLYYIGYTSDPAIVLYSIPVRTDTFSFVPESTRSVFSIFPNPAVSGITISDGKGSSENIRISVYSLDGRLMLDRESGQNESIFLDISMLTAGTYLLRISTGSSIETRKIIVQ